MSKRATLTEGWMYGGEVYGPGENVSLPDEAFENIKNRGGFEAEAQEPAGTIEMQQRLGKDTADLLSAAGYDSLSKVSGASDDDLDEIEGIGPAKIEKIREALK